MQVANYEKRIDYDPFPLAVFDSKDQKDRKDIVRFDEKTKDNISEKIFAVYRSNLEGSGRPHKYIQLKIMNDGSEIIKEGTIKSLNYFVTYESGKK